MGLTNIKKVDKIKTGQLNKFHSYNLENMARESLPNNRKLFDYE